MSFRRRSSWLRCVSVLALMIGAEAPDAWAQTPAAPEALGRVDLGASCAPAVQDQLNRAVALLHHMTYPAAMAGFQGVAHDDPGCAMAYWGAAMTLFQPLWPNRPSADDLRKGWELIGEARDHVAPGGREAGFVAAGEAFFDPRDQPEYWTRIERWADAMTELFEAYPDDREVRAFYALSRLATAARGDAAAHHEEAAEVLATILSEEPAHPGAVHYLIHANDFDGRERESLDVIRSYADIAPANPHALHMPTHIFVRLGEWQSVIEGNRKAADAALAERAGPDGEYVWDEFPHAVEYLVYAELQRADDGAAAEWIRSLDATPDLQPTFKTAFHLASTHARQVLERRDWSAATALTVPVRDGVDWTAFPWPESLVWYARGLGAARGSGSSEVLEESRDRLRELREHATSMGESLFADQIDVLRLEVEAWRSFALGERQAAVASLEDAAALEERTPKHPVTPGPMLPARELLGDLYLEAGEPDLALASYRASDARAPGRFNTVLGLARASDASGDAVSARRYYRMLVDGSEPSSTRAGLAEARAYLDR